MSTEIRAPQRKKLVGMFEEKKRIFCIKARNKKTNIEVPSSGLRLSYTPGDGVATPSWLFVPQCLGMWEIGRKQLMIFFYRYNSWRFRMRVGQ